MKSALKTSIANDPFADTLQVRHIGPKTLETIKPEPQKDDQTRKDKYFKGNIPNYERIDRGPRIDRTGLQIFISDRRKAVNTPTYPDKLSIPRQLKRAPISTGVKMIPMNLPKFGRGEAILMSNFPKQPSYKPSRRDLTCIENSPEQFVNTFEYDKSNNVLEDAQKEIDTSQNQLEKIRTILKQTRTEDNFLDLPNATTSLSKPSDSKDKVISTLNNLNRKLSDMQTKYFNQPKVSYKSIKDIPLKLALQSNSDIEMSTSNSDMDVQIETNIEMLEQYNATKLRNMQEFLCRNNEPPKTNMSFFGEVYNQTSVEVFPRVETQDKSTDYIFATKNSNSGSLSNSFKSTEDQQMKLPLSDSYSNTEIPKEAKTRILEKFHLTKIQKQQENSTERETNRKSDLFCDKTQNFSSSIPDVLIESDDSSSDFHSMLPQVDNNSLHKNSFENRSRTKMMKGERKPMVKKPSEIKRIQKLILNQDEELLEEIGFQSTTNKNLMTEDINNLRPKSSTIDFFDCDSRIELTADSPKASSKKIFYDNFGKYSSHSGKKTMGLGVEVNSVPNLPKTTTTQNHSRVPKTIFDDTPLQDSVLKSEFLSKTFNLDSPESRPKVSKNKSDQFFNGGVEAKNTKPAKISKDMYANLTKALNNSFYKLPPQN